MIFQNRVVFAIQRTVRMEVSGTKHENISVLKHNKQGKQPQRASNIKPNDICYRLSRIPLRKDIAFFIEGIEILCLDVLKVFSKNKYFALFVYDPQKLLNNVIYYIYCI